MTPHKQLTIRDVSPELARRLKALADANGTSLNKTVLSLLEKAVGVDERRRRLEERYGTWSAEDFDEFEQALQAQRTVDDELWR